MHALVFEAFKAVLQLNIAGRKTCTLTPVVERVDVHPPAKRQLAQSVELGASVACKTRSDRTPLRSG